MKILKYCRAPTLLYSFLNENVPRNEVRHPVDTRKFCVIELHPKSCQNENIDIEMKRMTPKNEECATDFVITGEVK